MRIDLALKYLCLVKSRSLVRTLCDNDAIWLNERPAKPSSQLHVRDHIRIRRSSGILTISLLSVPQKQLSKAEAPTYYRVVERTRTNESDRLDD